MTAPLGRRVGAEAIGTALLLATVVGSGIMADRLAGGQAALTLLANSLATGAALVVLILLFAPISGAHFNPVVTLTARGALGERAAYVAAQIVGGVAGVMLAHGMFELPIVESSTHVRAGGGTFLGEVVATFGLLLVIRGVSRSRPDATAAAVGLYIGAAYWFTSSTSFANPAVTLARTLTDSVTGIRPTDAPAFILAQFAGGGLAVLTDRWLATPSEDRPCPTP